MYENDRYGEANPAGYDWNRQQQGDFPRNGQTPGPVGGSAWGGKKPAKRPRGSLGVAGFWVAASALVTNVVAVILFSDVLRDTFNSDSADLVMVPDDSAFGKFFLLMILMLAAGVWGLAGLALGIAGLVFSSKDGRRREKVYSILAIVLTLCNPFAASILLNQFGFSLL